MMDKDIVPELLKSIDESFDNKNSKSRILKKAIKSLKDGNASYRDVNDLSVEIGQNLVDAISENIEQQLLPDEKMYFNISNRLMNHTLKNNYDIVSGYAEDVQNQLNVSSGLHLKAQVPEFNQEKVKGLVERLTNAETFDDISWILNEPLVTFTQSIVDDSIQKNVDFQYKAGLQPKITRTVVGKACKWCQSLAGSYLYSEAPKDIYRRHERCRCIVDYRPGDGRRQNVWSKAWKDPKKDDKIETRKQLNLKSEIKPDEKISGHSNPPKTYTPNGIVDKVDNSGKVLIRSFYGKDGYKKLDIHTTDHGNRKQHPYGKNGEHAHDYFWNPTDKHPRRTTRELTPRERKENKGIL